MRRRDEVSGCVALVTALVACMLHAAREPGLHGIPVSVALSESAGSHASRPCLCQGPHNLGLDQTGSGWCGRFFSFHRVTSAGNGGKAALRFNLLFLESCIDIVVVMHSSPVRPVICMWRWLCAFARMHMHRAT